MPACPDICVLIRLCLDLEFSERKERKKILNWIDFSCVVKKNQISFPFPPQIQDPHTFAIQQFVTTASILYKIEMASTFLTSSSYSSSEGTSHIKVCEMHTEATKETVKPAVSLVVVGKPTRTQKD